MQYRDAIVSCALACSVALLLVSVPSYAYLTTEDAYMKALEDPQWLSELPDELSGEVAGALAGILQLSPENEAAVAEYIRGDVTVSWARSQGEQVIGSVVAYISSSSTSIGGSIDISPYRLSLLELLYGIVPAFLIDLLSDYVPSELPLSLIMNVESMEGIRGMISLLGTLRYLSIVLCAVLCALVAWNHDVVPPSTLLVGVGGAGALTVAGVIVVRSRILDSFDSASVGFIASYGELFAGGYVSYMIPLVAASLVLVCASTALILLRFPLSKRPRR